MDRLSRRRLLSTGAAGSLAVVSAARADAPPQPVRAGSAAFDPGPRDAARDAVNPDLLDPPATDHGTLPNLRFSFADAHRRVTDGGWTRQVTQRELAVSRQLAGVTMRLIPGGVREMHWHKEGEWSYMLNGSARISAVDAEGRSFIDDVREGDLWYFPSGIPHAIQALGDGCEFLLVFDDGSFDEDSTFLISDWFRHIPPEVLAKNFGVPAEHFGHTPDPERRYIFPMPVPGPIDTQRVVGPGGTMPEPLSFRMLAQTPVRTRSGTVRIVDSRLFKASRTIAAALVEVEPGGLRELHWHPTSDEWQYYLSGQGRMGVFGATGAARTFDYRAGDVGYVPFAMGHYVENTGSTTLRFLEMFRSDRYADISLNQWMALTPRALVQGHLELDDQVMRALRSGRSPVVPA